MNGYLIIVERIYLYVVLFYGVDWKVYCVELYVNDFVRVFIVFGDISIESSKCL